MSQENVEVVRRATAAFTRRDNESVFDFYDAEVEISGSVDGHVYRGFDGVREFFRDWLEVWDRAGWEVEEWIDAGDDVIAVVSVWGRGKGSGIALEQRWAHVWTLRNGKLWRLPVNLTKAEALEAVGLSE